LILGKIIKIVTTRGQILRCKCSKLYVSWGSTADPIGFMALPRCPSWI